MPNDGAPRRRGRGRVVTVVVAAASAGCTVASANQGPDLHGAAPMSEQVRALDRLALKDPAAAPAGVDPMAWAALIPVDNRPTPERLELGRRLYFEPRLSKDQTVACATCHDATRSFTDRRPVSEGVADKLGTRNAPTTMNAALLGSQFWDARAASLEEQALLPIINPVEMAMPDGEAATRAIAADPEYQRLFAAAYGRPPSFEDIGRAIATFERQLIFLDAPFDRFLAGDADAISPAARRGWVLYNGQGRCMTCHPINRSSPLGTDHRFHNVGVSARHQKFGELARSALAELARDPSAKNIERLALASEASELGRFLISRQPADIGGFRTPQVRNAGVTAPYMHDGSMQTLWDVMDHYNKGGEHNRWLDGGIEPLALSEAQIDDMVAFLFTLTDDRLADLNRAEAERQQALAQKQRPFRDDAVAQRRKVTFEARK